MAMLKNIRVRLLAVGLLLSAQVISEQITDLNSQLIEQRLSTLQTYGTSDNDVTLDTYRKARSWLEKSANFESNAKNFVAALTSAPKREAEIIARMEAMGAEETASEEDYAGLSNQVLNAHLTHKGTELSDLTSARDNIETQLAAREENARQIRERLSAIAERVRELPESTINIDPNAVPSQLEASQWETNSELRALGAERRALEARLTSQPVRYRTYRVEREELTLRMDRISDTIRILKDLVATSRLSDTNLDETVIKAGNPAFPIAEKLASSSVELRAQTLELAQRLKITLAQSDEINRRQRGLNDSFATARRIVDFASDSDILGNILLAYWYDISAFEMSDVTVGISGLIGDTVINRIGHEKDRLTLANATGFVARRIKDADIDPDQIDDDVHDTLIELTESIRDRLTQIIAMESEFIEAARGLDTDYRQLTQLTDEYRTFLSGLILWVPSHPSVLDLDFRTIPNETSGLIQTLRELRISGVGLTTLGWLLLSTGLVMMRKRIKDTQTALNKRTVRLRDDSIQFTVGVLLLSVLRALPLPLLLMAGSSLFARVATPTGAALSSALDSLVAIGFALALIRVLCEESGLGRVHFRWDEGRCERIKNQVAWLTRWCLPVIGATLVLLAMERETIDATLGRLMLLVTLSMLTARTILALRSSPKTTQAAVMMIEPQRLSWAILGIIALLFLGLMSGHIYSVGLVIESAVDSLWAIIILDLLYALLMRWLKIARRRLRLEELIAARTTPEDSDSGIDDSQVDLVELSAATSQLLKIGIGTAGVMALVFIWAPLLPMLDMLENITLWTTSSLIDGEPVLSPITLETLIIVLFIGLATFYGARKLPALVELVMRSHAGITTGTYYTASTLLSYLIVGSGMIAVASALGLKWSELQWLVAALGVGIGFGLQEIVANFFSGLIILFERPIRVGDVVTVGESEGVVTRIRIRATTIKDWDGKELLVPNKEFISGRLLNWTLSDQLIRVVVNVGIAYGSDVEQALSILEEIASDHDGVLEEPPPSIIFNEFGDNALQLSARCFVRSFDDRWPVLTSLHREVYARFEAAGIVIAFPQRDVHFDSENPIRIALEGGQGLSARPAPR